MDDGDLVPYLKGRTKPISSSYEEGGRQSRNSGPGGPQYRHRHNQANVPNTDSTPSSHVYGEDIAQQHQTGEDQRSYDETRVDQKAIPVPPASGECSSESYKRYHVRFDSGFGQIPHLYRAWLEFARLLQTAQALYRKPHYRFGSPVPVALGHFLHLPPWSVLLATSLLRGLTTSSCNPRSCFSPPLAVSSSQHALGLGLPVPITFGHDLHPLPRTRLDTPLTLPLPVPVTFGHGPHLLPALKALSCGARSTLPSRPLPPSSSPAGTVSPRKLSVAHLLFIAFWYPMLLCSDRESEGLGLAVHAPGPGAPVRAYGW